jgi:pectinesterase
MSDVVRPEGWNNWGKPEREKTTVYAEGGSTGPGAAPDKRVSWAKKLTAGEIAQLTPAKVLAGADGWDPAKVNVTNAK